MTWTVGAVLPAADLNTYLPQATTTWASPVFANLTTTTGTITANYTRVGKIVVASFQFVFGASSAVTGDIQLTLPIASVTKTPVGGGYLFDTSASSSAQALVIQTTGTTVVAIKALVASGTYATTSACSSTIPFTWATGDEINVTFSYLSA